MNKSEIRYNNQPVSIDRIDRNTFCVHLPNRDLRLQYQPDNEGADHWLDLDSNRETEETRVLGEQLSSMVDGSED
ncbi:MAG TPA: hypothetical protein VF145_05115 [Chitinophagaceae bacterium]